MEEKVTPEDLVEKLKSAAQSEIRSVVLYGSSAAGDRVEKRSDYNILVITERLSVKELKVFSRPAKAWVKAGNPPPLFFTLDQLQKSADVFPIEILDMRESHRILFGEDVLSEVEVHYDNLRLELEHELKSKLIQLRENFVLTGGKTKHVVELMIQSLSSFLVLLRGALRLYQNEVPPHKLDAMKALSRHIDFDTGVFITVEELKKGQKKPKQVDSESLFERYLRTIESVVDRIDAHVQRGKNG